MHTCRFYVGMFVAAATLGCGVDTTTVPTLQPPHQDMAVTTKPTQPYCGGKGKAGLWLGDCSERCLPDEQIWFLCTEKRGMIAYTRAGLMATTEYAYNWEYPQTKCADSAYSVWKPVPIVPAPTNADTGQMSYDTLYTPNCAREALHPPYIDKNQDRRYYTVVAVSPSSQ